MHVISAGVGHVRDHAKICEESLLQISIDLVHHFLGLLVVFHCVQDLTEPRTVVISDMQLKILHLRHDVQLKLWVDLGPR